MYKVADIGTGTHGLLAMLNPKLDTIAFCDISDKKRNDAVKIARVLKEKMKADKEPTPVRGYADYREMIEQEEPDIVTIMTPDEFHADMSVFALEHGAHVFVEKPMCLTLEECERMIDAVRRTGRKLAVNQCARTIQAFHTVFDIQAHGDLGLAYYIRAEYLHGSMRRVFEDPGSWRRRKKTTLGGSSHAIDLVLGLMGEQAECVCASASKHMFSADVRTHDMDNVLMRFPGDRAGYCVTDLGSHRRGLGMAFELYATKTDVIQAQTHTDERDVDRGARSGLRFYDASGARTIHDGQFSDTQMEIELGHGQGFYRQQENLVYAIEHDTKQRTMADVVDGARTVSVGVAAVESIETGKTAPVRQWEPLAYKGGAPLWDLDDYQKDMLRAYVPILSKENRKKILSGGK